MDLKENINSLTITGAVINIISFEIALEDTLKEKENMKKLKEFIASSEEDKEFADIYPFIELMIASSLVDDCEYNYAEDLYNHIIKPCSALIEEGSYEEAKELYEEMIINLAEQYGIDGLIPSKTVEAYYNRKTKKSGRSIQMVQQKTGTNY